MKKKGDIVYSEAAGKSDQFQERHRKGKCIRRSWEDRMRDRARGKADGRRGQPIRDPLHHIHGCRCKGDEREGRKEMCGEGLAVSSKHLQAMTFNAFAFQIVKSSIRSADSVSRLW